MAYNTDVPSDPVRLQRQIHANGQLIALICAREQILYRLGPDQEEAAQIVRDEIAAVARSVERISQS